MQKRHFEAIAKGVRESIRYGVLSVAEATAVGTFIASELQPFNNLFDFARFVRACSEENGEEVKVLTGPDNQL